MHEVDRDPGRTPRSAAKAWSRRSSSALFAVGLTCSALTSVAFGAIDADESPQGWSAATSQPAFVSMDGARGTAAPSPATARATPDRPTSAHRAPKSAPLDLSTSTMRRAIAEAKDPLDDVTIARGGTFGTGGPSARERIDRAFSDADIPSCLTPDAFKFDPPRVGLVTFGGLLGAPFLLHAIATGRCRH